MNTLRKDQIIFRNEVPSRIVRVVEGIVQLENAKTGEFTQHQVESLLNEYVSGTLTVSSLGTNSRQSNGRIPTDVVQPVVNKLSQIETRRRADYIVKLQESGAFNLGRNRLIDAVAEIAKERGENRAPHITTIYRWRKKFLVAKKHLNALLCKFANRGGKGKERLDPSVEAILHEKIDLIYLTMMSMQIKSRNGNASCRNGPPMCSAQELRRLLMVLT